MAESREMPMTKQQRFALASEYIAQARNRYENTLNVRRDLKRTLESFPPYVNLTKEFEAMPKDYDEFLKLREKSDGDPLLEWNYLTQWKTNISFLDTRIATMESTVSMLNEALEHLKNMGENNPLLDLPGFYSDFLGALQIGLTSSQLQEFLD